MSKAPLILVVGPSGAGKDSLIDGARATFTGDPSVHFAHRCVTRPTGAGGEDHFALSEAAFAATERAGGFLLSWRAHGLAYGVPCDVEDLRRQGVAVIANVSRGVVDEARRLHGPVGVVAVDASPAVLAERLLRRGREDRSDIAARLARAAALPTGADVRRVVNDADLPAGIDAFIAAVQDLRRWAGSAARRLQAAGS